ncbi:MAG: hypothetical protein ABFS56_21305 [Pseudomonadota bacterium]
MGTSKKRRRGGQPQGIAPTAPRYSPWESRQRYDEKQEQEQKHNDIERNRDFLPVPAMGLSVGLEPMKDNSNENRNGT